MPLVNFAEIGGIVVNTRVNYTSYDNIIIKVRQIKYIIQMIYQLHWRPSLI